MAGSGYVCKSSLGRYTSSKDYIFAGRIRGSSRWLCSGSAFVAEDRRGRHGPRCLQPLGVCNETKRGNDVTAPVGTRMLAALRCGRRRCVEFSSRGMSDQDDSDSPGGVALHAPTTSTTTAIEEQSHDAETSATTTTIEASGRSKKLALTHFLSLPLHHAPGLHDALESFAANLTSLLSPPLPTGALRPAAAYHLTLGVLHLPTAAALSTAITALESLDVRALLLAASAPRPEYATLPLRISLRGLETTNTPRRASVLYTRPEDTTNRLQPFAESVRAVFLERGLLQEGGRPLKLHATVVNTVYARRGGRRGGGKGKRPHMFDAQKLLEANRDRIFVEDVEIEKIALCKMGAVERDGVKGAGGYEIVAEKRLDATLDHDTNEEVPP